VRGQHGLLITWRLQSGPTSLLLLLLLLLDGVLLGRCQAGGRRATAACRSVRRPSRNGHHPDERALSNSLPSFPQEAAEDMVSLLDIPAVICRHLLNSSSLGTQSTACRRRLIRDFKRLSSDPPFGVSGAPCADNLMLWNAVIFGPGAYALSLCSDCCVCGCRSKGKGRELGGVLPGQRSKAAGASQPCCPWATALPLHRVP
jgi:hypothetical protein